MLTGTLGATAVTGRLRGKEITFTAGKTNYTGQVNGHAMSGTMTGGRTGTGVRQEVAASLTEPPARFLRANITSRQGLSALVVLVSLLASAAGVSARQAPTLRPFAEYEATGVCHVGRTTASARPPSSAIASASAHGVTVVLYGPFDAPEERRRASLPATAGSSMPLVSATSRCRRRPGASGAATRCRFH